jgi:hypothetical protein
MLSIYYYGNVAPRARITMTGLLIADVHVGQQSNVCCSYVY